MIYCMYQSFYALRILPLKSIIIIIIDFIFIVTICEYKYEKPLWALSPSEVCLTPKANK